jgi:hypothetical protein
MARKLLQVIMVAYGLRFEKTRKATESSFYKFSPFVAVVLLIFGANTS